MSELQEIEVIIAPNGEVKVHVQGVKGSKCTDITKGMEELLGGNVLERTETDEYYEVARDETQSDWA